MPIRVGSGFLEILPKLADTFDRDVERQVNPALAKVGSNLKKTGAVMTATLTPVALAAGAAFNKAFQQFDAGVDSIRAGTGATGKALEGLTQSMENVGANVSQPLSEIGGVMGELASKTNLTGQPLERLSTQVLTLARVTGTDARSSVAALTRVFGDWGVATKDQSRTLDLLFRASQKTGVPVQRLSEMVVQFGAPLRNLGFGLSESTALLGRFEKEGVNTELVLSGLRIALGHFTGQGEEAKEEIAGLETELSSANDRVGQLAEGVTSANDRLSQLQSNVGGAKTRIGDLARELQSAKRSLDEALAGPSANDVEGASIGIERARLREKEAADEVQDAERSLRDLRRTGGTAEEIEDAQRRIESARLSEREAVIAAAQAEERLHEIRQKGTAHDPAVIAARERIRDVTQQMTDADKGLAQAQADVAKGRQDVAKAEADLAKVRGERGAIASQLEELKALKTANPQQALEDLFDAMRGAKTAGEAAQIGMDVFGKRAINDVVDAVRAGKFDVDDLMESIAESPDTIAKAGEDTKDLSDEMKELTNALQANLGPFGEMGSIISGAVGFIGPMVFGIGALTTALEGSAVASTLASAAMTALPFVAIGVAVAALAYLIYRNWDTIWRVTKQIFGAIGRFVGRIFGGISGAIGGVIKWVKENWPTLLAILTGPIGIAVKFVVDHFDEIKTKVSGVFRGIVGAIKGATNGIIRGLNWLIGLVEKFINLQVRAYNKIADAPVIGAILPHMNEITLPRIKLLARGGQLGAGDMAVVGEQGPELIQAGRRPVTVQPSSHLAALSGAAVVVPVYLDGRQIATAMTPHLRSKRKRDGDVVIG